jgi:hypothetical protein
MLRCIRRRRALFARRHIHFQDNSVALLLHWAQAIRTFADPSGTDALWLTLGS